jgi:hypothetical protein
MRFLGFKPLLSNPTFYRYTPVNMGLITWEQSKQKAAAFEAYFAGDSSAEEEEDGLTHSPPRWGSAR